MTEREAFKSLSRHHIAAERELEAYRAAYRDLVLEVERVRKMFPGIAVRVPAVPIQTKRWVAATHRDKTGRIPANVRQCITDEGLHDWLEESDYARPRPTDPMGDFGEDD